MSQDLASGDQAEPSSGGPQTHISISGLNKTYNLDSDNPTPALRDIDLEIAEDEFVSIIGPSGCGKTTLLKCIGDIVEPSSGEIRIGGQSPKAMRKNRKMAFYFQEDVLLPWRSVMQNVLLPLQIQGEDVDSPEVRSKAEETINQVGLEGFKDQMPAQLSGGMRQRVALARGFVYNPEIFLMDEPFAALDELTRRKMNELLLNIHQQVKKTTVFVTHHISEAVWLSDRVVILSDRPGEIDEIVKIDLDRPRDNETRQSERCHEYEDRLTEKLIESE